VVQCHRSSSTGITLICLHIVQRPDLQQDQHKFRRIIKQPTMTLLIIPSSSPAAGHSGQNSTARRSEIKLSNIARYSASLLDFVILVLPDLENGTSANVHRMSLAGDTSALEKGRLSWQTWWLIPIHLCRGSSPGCWYISVGSEKEERRYFYVIVAEFGRIIRCGFLDCLCLEPHFHDLSCSRRDIVCRSLDQLQEKSRDRAN